MFDLDFTEDEIARRLAEGYKSTYSDEAEYEEIYPPGFFNQQPRPAAVLIPLVLQDHAWHILFTRRTESLPEHSGQVAFPGGRTDPEDLSPEATALREASEEIGVNPTGVRLLGRLKSITTITNYRVTPVIGRMDWPLSLRLATHEVSRAFTIPLSWLADPANHEIRPRILPPPYPAIPVIYFQPYDGELLWGVSAHITINLLKVLVWQA